MSVKCQWHFVSAVSYFETVEFENDNKKVGKEEEIIATKKDLQNLFNFKREITKAPWETKKTLVH